MGYIRHHAIVVTSWSKLHMEAAHRKAVELAGTLVAELITEPTKPAINGYRSFLFAPDGSKEGWPESDQGDSIRDRFITWLNEQRNSDGSSALEWAEVEFGNDEGENIVTRHGASMPEVTS